MRKPAALLALAAACLLAACGPPARSPVAADRAPSVGPATGTLAAGETLPIAAYEFTPGQLKAEAVAYVLLYNRCMAAHGFSGLAEPSTDRRDFDPMVGRYGADADGYATSGYHYKAFYISGRATTEPPAWAVEAKAKGRPTRSAEEQHVADGSVRSYGGADVPAGGCEGDAKRQLVNGGGYYGPPELPGRIDADSFDQSLTDPQVQAGFAAWSGCMAEGGRSYPDPLSAAGDKRWNTPVPTADELATARADLACKRRTGLVPTWLHVEQRLQQTAIAQHGTELAAVKAGEQASVRTATAIAGVGPTAP
ncbi:hypothetical protein F4556_005762 [Kitasatospora gansuensis]|uniref:Lipoprotein n=1 Tax=Kitasatospora gansuensis TaxID=258050 RepID=A0A7W7SHM7_9ACTN|nr:hypothetical protein [Kitasatospora gansuensis]MBB4950227.1 hypothetical protein [Kitasatospora gansuensis]